MTTVESRDRAEWITALIRNWVDTAPENTLGGAAREPAWDDPLVGFARGDDAYWDSFKEHVGPFHWTPAEAFGLAFPGGSPSGRNLSVISWILPQTRATKLDSRRERTYPPERWARSRICGEAANEALRRFVVAELGKAGIRAAAPVLLPQWARMPSEKFTFASKWSERHAAFVSGLGTFGLSDGLITPRGKAMRTGSVVAEIVLPPTPRAYRGHRDWCLWFSRGTCRKCAARCPVGALSERGHDKIPCSKHVHETCKSYIVERFGFEGYACGLCQTGVPCESRIPRAESDGTD